jgi:serine/threonine-protein kinase
MDEQNIFTTALEQSTRAERDAYLDRVCADNSILRSHLNALLAAHDRVEGLLESDLFVDVDSLDGLIPGTLIGNYRLIREIGDGGFGVVFLAEQLQPIQRQVAIKIVKLGMDTRQVVARFQSERQTLALMKHPNIATVYDAGATEAGRPYFAMEFVDGVPITRFCDAQQLTIPDRVGLLVTVCRAIHHAHTKGIIHRDIKPSNVLVSNADGHPLAKVIDFGVSKALQPSDGIDLNLTRDQQLVGTPNYMSPEQAAGRHDEIDTRSDVYALGTLAYELLTGTTPFTYEESGGWDAFRENVIKIEPTPPSQRIAVAKDLSFVEHRRSTLNHLKSQLRGDLDWILLTALAKDRNRRYQSASALADDLERFLRDEPIDARPPDLLYRAGKFVRRRRSVLLATLAAIVLLATFGSTHWITRQRFERQHQQRVSHSRQQIENELHKAYQWYDVLRTHTSNEIDEIGKSLAAAKRAEALLASADADTNLTHRVQGLLTRLEREQGELQFLEQMKDLRLTFPSGARPSNEEDDDGRQQTSTLEHFSLAFHALDIHPLAESADVAADRLRQRPEEVLQMAVAALDLWAISLDSEVHAEMQQWLQSVARLADPDPWRTSLRQAISELDLTQLAALATAPELEDQPPPALMVLANVLQQQQHPAAITVLRRAADANPDVFVFNALMGNLYSRQGASLNAEAIRRAIRYLSAALAVRPDDQAVINNLATNLSRSGEHDDAVAMLQRTVEKSPKHWQSWQNLSLALCRKRDYSQALYAAHQSILNMHLVSNTATIPNYMRQTLERIQLCIEIESSASIQDQLTWRVLMPAPDTYPTTSSLDAFGSPAQFPIGTSLFPSATHWNSKTLTAACRLSVDQNSDLASVDSTSLLFVISAAGKGDITIDGKHIARYRDVAGDPRSYVCPPEIVKTLRESEKPLVCIVSAEKTKEEALLDVDIRWANVRQIRDRLRDIVQLIQKDLAQPAYSTSSSSSDSSDPRQPVREAFEIESHRLWQVAR